MITVMVAFSIEKFLKKRMKSSHSILLNNKKWAIIYFCELCVRLIDLLLVEALCSLDDDGDNNSLVHLIFLHNQQL